jgi:hypothetical protein
MKLRMIFLLVVGLTAMAVAAQPARPGSGTVDTREECTALQGSWNVAGNGWQASCEVPWSREDCLQLGGAWTQVAKAATGGRCLARLSEFALAQQCLDRGGQWGPQGSPTQSCTFVPRPSRTVGPVRAPDTGKRCDSQKDCMNGCVYQGPPVAAGADVTGHCRASAIARGCYSMVESGRLAGSVCVK